MTAIIKALQRHCFAARSETIDTDQLGLNLEDIEQALAVATAEAE